VGTFYYKLVSKFTIKAYILCEIKNVVLGYTATEISEKNIKRTFSCFEVICYNTVVTGVVIMNIKLRVLYIAGTQKIVREPSKSCWKPHGSISAAPTHAVSSPQCTDLYPHKATVVSGTAFAPNCITDQPEERGGYPSKSRANHRKVRIHYQHHDSPFMKSFLHPQYEKLSYTCFSIFVAHSRVRVNCFTCSKWQNSTHELRKNVGSTEREIASRVVTAACSVIREQTRMIGFIAFSAVLVRTTANVVSGGVYVILVIRGSLQ
jgi:hypothetical protein